MRILGIRTRRTALGVLAACFATFLVSAVADGSAQQRDQTPRQVADTAAESRAMDDGCKLAGVIPNCEAEVAKAVARQAALPKPPAPPAPAASRGGDRYAQCDIFLEESWLAGMGYRRPRRPRTQVRRHAMTNSGIPLPVVLASPARIRSPSRIRHRISLECDPGRHRVEHCAAR